MKHTTAPISDSPCEPQDTSRDGLSRDTRDETPWLGVDVGGANIKAAHTQGWSASQPFPLWSRPQQLATALASLLDGAPPFVGVALTMTGELADCFLTRAHGVAHILEQVTSIIPASMLKVYGVDGKWYSAANAAREPWIAAASNWHALANYIGMHQSDGCSLVIDIGSTTTDLIPLSQGTISISAQTDSQRLQCGALVYTGIERSNVASISKSLPLFGKQCPTMNEAFATTRDVHMWLGDLSEEPGCLSTADGRPATREGARFRLARMVGEDGSTLADSDVDAIAAKIRLDQGTLIAKGIQQVMSASVLEANSRSKGGRSKQAKVRGASDVNQTIPDRIILCGHGDFLLEDALRILEWNVPRILWSKELGGGLSRCAPAYAAAKLARMD